jgi:hypothetical protein
MREQSIQELIANVEWTKKLVFEVYRLDQQMTKISTKPIRGGCFVSAFVFLSSGSFLLASYIYGQYKISSVIAIAITLSPILALAILIFITNRLLIQVKKGVHEKLIRVYPIQRKKFMDSLKSDSVIPSAYWNSVYLDRINTYFINKRADSVKEALNLLESDIKHDQQMQKLQSIEDSIPRVFIGVSTEI